MGCVELKTKIDALNDLSDLSEVLTSEERAHVTACDGCQQIVNDYGRVDNMLQGMRSVTPPAGVTQHYVPGLLQKLERQTRAPAPRPRGLLSPRLRLAWAGMAIALVSIVVWRFGDLTAPVARSDEITSDSLEYYLESFNEVSSVNPIYVVKEMDYDWTEYEIPDVAQD